MQHPCNRFGFGLNAHQVNYGQQQHVPAPNYHHHGHHTPISNSPCGNNSMAAVQKSWSPVNVSLPQNLNSRAPSVPSVPLTPPADRESSPAAHAAPVGHHAPYYSMLHQPIAYSQSPIDKSMTPPQETQESIQPIGWWPSANGNLGHVHSAAANAHGRCNSTEYGGIYPIGLGHSQHHHPTVASPNTGHRNLEAAPAMHHPINPHHPQSNPSEFQQRVAAALLKTHATLASRRCRRCRCPNCQVNISLFLSIIPTEMSKNKSIKSGTDETNEMFLFIEIGNNWTCWT